MTFPRHRRKRPAATSRRHAATRFRSLLVQQMEPRELLAIFVVDRIDDTNAPTAQVCSAAPNDCSLRGAISKANATAGADELQFAASTNGTPFTLTIANPGGVNEDANATGDLDATDSLAITGNGAANTIIQAGTDATNGIDRVFSLNPAQLVAMNFTLTGLTVRFGRNTQHANAGILNRGGGINFRGTGSCSLTIADTVVSQNTTITSGGGGLSFEEELGTSSLSITNSQFTANSAGTGGGGIVVSGDSGSITISGSTISNNRAATDGGGLYVEMFDKLGSSQGAPVVTVTNCTILDNTAGRDSGGIELIRNLDAHITNTVIEGNALTGSGNGGGMLIDLHLRQYTATLTNVLIASNKAEAGAADKGGGIFLNLGKLFLINATIAQNTANADGGGLYINGFGAASASLNNVTIAENRSDADGNVVGTGGAIYVDPGGLAKLTNTILDSNYQGTGSFRVNIGGEVIAHHSLIDSTVGATITGANNLLNVAAGLNGLEPNKGPEVGPAGFTRVLKTYCLREGSPALDAGQLRTLDDFSTDSFSSNYNFVNVSNDAANAPQVAQGQASLNVGGGLGAFIWNGGESLTAIGDSVSVDLAFSFPIVQPSGLAATTSAGLALFSDSSIPQAYLRVETDSANGQTTLFLTDGTTQTNLSGTPIGLMTLTATVTARNSDTLTVAYRLSGSGFTTIAASQTFSAAQLFFGPAASNVAGAGTIHDNLLFAPCTPADSLRPLDLATDQRGAPRALDAADLDTFRQVDIGSYEATAMIEPVADQILSEDGTLVLTINVGDPSVSGLDVSAVAPGDSLLPADPANFNLTGSGSTRTLIIHPAENEHGSTFFSIEYQSDFDSLVRREIRLEVSPVNDPPTVVLAGSAIVAADIAGLQIVDPFLIAVLPGGGSDEASQQIIYGIDENSNPELFTVSPTLDASGALSFIPKLNAQGIATITITAIDDGESAAPNLNTGQRTFTITIEKPHPWHNSALALDVTGEGGIADGHIVAEDALAIINFLNAFGSGPVPENAASSQPFGYLDVLPDDFIAASDALEIINALNAGLGGEGENSAAPPTPLATLSSPQPTDLITLLVLDTAHLFARRKR